MKKAEKLYRSLGSVRDEWLDDAMGSNLNENSNATVLRKTPPLRRLLIAATVCVLFCSLAITCFANSDLIKSLFQREQELINPHSVMIEKQDESEGYTLTVEKILTDEDIVYVYYKLHSPKPFEVGYLTYKEVQFGIEHKNDDNEIGILPRATVEPGHHSAKESILAGAYIGEVKEPTCDFEGVLEMRKVLSGEFVTVASGKKVIRSEPMDWESGKYHFAISGLSVSRWIPDENGKINDDSGMATFDYAKSLDVAFDLDVNDLENMPSTVWNPDSEFTLEGCDFKVTEIKQTAKNLWVTVESTSDKLIEIEDQHFNPLAIFMKYEYSNEFNIYDPHSFEEVVQFSEIYKRNQLWERSYNFGVRFTSDSKELYQNGKYSYKFEFKEGGYDRDIIKLRFIFDEPVYTEDIAGIYAYNDLIHYPIGFQPEEPTDRFELDIWENK